MKSTRWQVQEAKQRFSELVERAIREGPQTVTRRGVDVVVVIDAQRYRRLTDDGGDLKRLLREMPEFDGADVVRRREAAPLVEL